MPPKLFYRQLWVIGGLKRGNGRLLFLQKFRKYIFVQLKTKDIVQIQKL